MDWILKKKTMSAVLKLISYFAENMLYVYNHKKHKILYLKFLGKL
jgi:hypothetical protein